MSLAAWHGFVSTGWALLVAILRRVTTANIAMRSFVAFGIIRKVDGMQLKRARERLGLNQEQMAEALGTTQATISRWESNAMKIEQPTILRLAIEHLKYLRKRK